MPKIEQLLNDTLVGLPTKEKIYPITIGEAVHVTKIDESEDTLTSILKNKSGYYYRTIVEESGVNYYYLYGFSDFLSFQYWERYKDKSDLYIKEKTDNKFDRESIQALKICSIKLHEVNEQSDPVTPPEETINGAIKLSRFVESVGYKALDEDIEEVFETSPATINPFIPYQYVNEYKAYSSDAPEIHIQTIPYTEDESLDCNLLISRKNGSNIGVTDYALNVDNMTMDAFVDMYREYAQGTKNYSKEASNIYVWPSNTAQGSTLNAKGAVKVYHAVPVGTAKLIIDSIYVIVFSSDFVITSPLDGYTEELDMDGYIEDGKKHPYIQRFWLKTEGAVNDMKVVVPEGYYLCVIKNGSASSKDDEITISAQDANSGIYVYVMNHRTTELVAVEQDSSFNINIYHGNQLVRKMTWTVKANVNYTEKEIGLKETRTYRFGSSIYIDETDEEPTVMRWKEFEVSLLNVDEDVKLYCNLYQKFKDKITSGKPFTISIYGNRNVDLKHPGSDEHIDTVLRSNEVTLYREYFTDPVGDENNKARLWVKVVLDDSDIETYDTVCIECVSTADSSITSGVKEFTIYKASESSTNDPTLALDNSGSFKRLFFTEIMSRTPNISDIIENTSYPISPEEALSLTDIPDFFMQYDDTVVELDLSMFTNLKTIGDYAFADCTNLKKLILPDSVTSIGKGLCSGCTSLEYVYLGSGVSEILNKSFDGCPALSDLYIPFIGTGVDATTQQEMQYGVMCVMDLGGTNKFFDDNIDLTVHVHEDLVEAYPTAWSTLVTQYGENLTFVAIEDNTNA